MWYDRVSPTSFRSSSWWQILTVTDLQTGEFHDPWARLKKPWLLTMYKKASSLLCDPVGNGKKSQMWLKRHPVYRNSYWHCPDIYLNFIRLTDRIMVVFSHPLNVLAHNSARWSDFRPSIAGLTNPVIVCMGGGPVVPEMSVHQAVSTFEPVHTSARAISFKMCAEYYSDFHPAR